MKTGDNLEKIALAGGAVSTGDAVNKDILIKDGWRHIIGFGCVDLLYKFYNASHLCLLWRPRDEKVTGIFVGDDSYSR